MTLACELVSHTIFSSILDGEVTVVTAGARLANYFRQQSEAAAINANMGVWVSPDVLPWPHWIQRLWEEAVVTESVKAQGQVLTSTQQEFLWEQIVSASEDGKALLQTCSAARDAMNAWGLLKSWSIKLDGAGFSYNDDSSAFKNWSKRFEKECARQGWIQAEVLPDLLSEAIASECFSASNSLILAGFDEFTPQQLCLIKALQNSGTKVRWVKVEEESAKVSRVTCTDVYEETRLIAQWARQRLEARPDARIGVIVPDLSSMRTRVLSSLDEVMLPEKWSPNSVQSTSVYNVSLGLPLKNYPVIRAALLLLEFISDPLSLNDACLILRSPFIIGWEDEHDTRALLDEKLRKVGELVVSLDRLKSFAGQNDCSYACPVFVQRLDEMSEKRILLNKQMPSSHMSPGHMSPSKWAEYFSIWLKASGWTQGRTLNSEEYQATEAFKNVISTFGSLDAMHEVFSEKEAINWLNRLAMERIFQPETEDTPVQVLGILEATGLCFDHVWVMGLHEDVWPPSPHPVPFLPLPMQRSQDLPRSSSERELRIAKLVMQRLFKSGKEVIVSYPANKGEEKLQCSPLILGISEIDRIELNVWGGKTWRELIFTNRILEKLDSDPAPHVSGKNISGGSRIFEYQAICPFRAFATFRLGARPLESVSIGLSPLIRGNLVHKVLESVWGQLDSWDTLNKRSDEQLQQLVGKSVDSVLKDTVRKYPNTFTARFRALEGNRLAQLVLDWLNVEKARTPFQIRGREKEFNVTVGGVNIRLIIDRIDELPDGSQLLIDYKTGKVSPGKWFGERPEEPQLPLYATVVGGNIGGVAFGSLLASDIRFNGVTRDAGVLPSVNRFDEWKYTKKAGSWSQVLKEWQKTLQDLGADFCKGNAKVDPKNPPTTCQYCGLQSLCRIHERAILDGIEAD